MKCQPHCAACCIAPSISSPIPGMPEGKAANQVCIQLDNNKTCRLFAKPDRPRVCLDFSPTEELCSKGADHAFITLHNLETLTRPR